MGLNHRITESKSAALTTSQIAYNCKPLIAGYFIRYPNVIGVFNHGGLDERTKNILKGAE